MINWHHLFKGGLTLPADMYCIAGVAITHARPFTALGKGNARSRAGYAYALTLDPQGSQGFKIVLIQKSD